MEPNPDDPVYMIQKESCCGKFLDYEDISYLNEDARFKLLKKWQDSHQSKLRLVKKSIEVIK